MVNAITDQSVLPLLEWLTKRLDGQDLAPPREAQEELAYLAERLVRLYLEKRQPLRRAAVAKKLATLSKNLQRAAKAASELGEDGISHVLLASGSHGGVETADPLGVIGNLQDWARWSTKAADTAKLMSLSAEDHKGGRTPDVRLRSLVTILMDRFEFLLGIKATHVVDPDTGLGHSTFDLFVKEAIRALCPGGHAFRAAPYRRRDQLGLTSRKAICRAELSQNEPDGPDREQTARVSALDRLVHL